MSCTSVHRVCVPDLGPGRCALAAPVRAAVKDSTSSISTQTNASWSSTMSLMWSNNFVTNLPDSLNHLLNNEWALISSKKPLE